jgi:hypothetical protein
MRFGHADIGGPARWAKRMTVMRNDHLAAADATRWAKRMTSVLFVDVAALAWMRSTNRTLSVHNVARSVWRPGEIDEMHLP